MQDSRTVMATFLNSEHSFCICEIHFHSTVHYSEGHSSIVQKEATAGILHLKHYKVFCNLVSRLIHKLPVSSHFSL